MTAEHDSQSQVRSVLRAGSPVTFATYDRLVKRVAELERKLAEHTPSTDCTNCPKALCYDPSECPRYPT